MNNLILILLASYLSVSRSAHLIQGDTNKRTLIHHGIVQYNAIPFTKRSKAYFYNDPGQNIINSILIYDNLYSTATAEVTAGGVGYSYVNIEFLSERGKGFDYDTGLMAIIGAPSGVEQIRLVSHIANRFDVLTVEVRLSCITHLQVCRRTRKWTRKSRNDIVPKNLCSDVEMRLLVLISCFFCFVTAVLCYDMIAGDTVHRKLVFHQRFKDFAIPFKKRIRSFTYKDPESRVIKGVAVIDNDFSHASANITSGGIGQSYVTVRMKSQRHHPLNFELEIYM